MAELSGGEALAILLYVLLFVRLALGLGASIDHTRKRSRSRRGQAALEALARDRGWTYRPTSPEPLDRFGTDYPFSISPAQDVITGTHRGRPFWCYEGAVTDPPGGQPTYRRVFVVERRSSGPTLQVTRQGYGQLREPTGASRVELADPGFDALLQVSTDDEAYARTVLDPPMRSWLVATGPVGLVLRFTGAALVTWQDRRLTAKSVERIVNYLCDVLDRVEPGVTAGGGRWRYHPPPGWPVPPDDWVPPPDWRPDPTWPPAPSGWAFWVPAEAGPAPPLSAPAPAPTRPGRRARTVVIAALTAAALVAATTIVAMVRSGVDLPAHVREVYSRRGGIGAMAVGQPDSDPVVAVLGDAGTGWQVRDLATGDRLSTLHQPGASSIAIGELPGTPIAVTSGGSVVRAFDLRTGEQRHEFTGHSGYVESVAVGELAGTPIAVSASNRDHTLRLWDLTTGGQIGGPFGNLLDWDEGQALAVTEVDGRTLVVDGYRGGLAVWEVGAGVEPVLDMRLSEGATSELSAARTVAIGDLDGTPVAFAGSGSGPMPGSDVVMAWDLTTGNRLAQLRPPGQLGAPTAIALSELDGAPVAVVAYSWDGAILVWDLVTNRPIREPVTGHTGRITQLATARLDGEPVVVSGGDDGRVLVWPLAPPSPASGSPAAAGLLPGTDPVRAPSYIANGIPGRTTGGGRAWRNDNGRAGGCRRRPGGGLRRGGTPHGDPGRR
jgi:hypothetical protein